MWSIALISFLISDMDDMEMIRFSAPLPGAICQKDYLSPACVIPTILDFDMAQKEVIASR